jgi:predicted solute-binding protein
MKDTALKRQGASACAVGCASYWSFLPLVAELRRFSGSVNLQLNHPDQVGQSLESGRLDIGFCSATRLLVSSDLELALPLGESVIGSVGTAYLGVGEQNANLCRTIDSRLAEVKAIFQRTMKLRQADTGYGAEAFWQEVRRAQKNWVKLVPPMRLCGSSAAYTGLARIIYRLLFGDAALETLDLASPTSGYLDESAAGLDLRQGNGATAKRCCYQYALDLADIWYDLTGLPFVPHILAKSKRMSLSGNAKSQLQKAAELAQAKMHVDPCSYFPDLLPVNQYGQRIDLGSIWKNVSYRLSSDAIKSLWLFLHFARPLEKKRLGDEAFRLQMMRWQERERSSGLYH